MERRAITIQGTVQGVGFRPFVHNLATRLQLGGFVKNQSGKVLIEIEGNSSALDRFLAELDQHPPPLAIIDQLDCQRAIPQGEKQFRIAASEGELTGPIFISPDVATCPACLAELFDPADRHYHYPFLNCTSCGPRLTIVLGSPYDRARTTMAGFPMCAACLSEYNDPANRRFHAQPAACPRCGPQLQLLNAAGEPVATNDPVGTFAAELLAGRIGALKGLGGYHLACVASNALAVQELRRRKQRDDKPFAVMVEDLAAAQTLCAMNAAEEQLLLSPRRPIVLLRKRAATALAAAVAPGNPYLGVLLPYTPLHHLLLRAVCHLPLVMTSGNRSDEPIAYEDAEAVQRLANIADHFLLHNRPIHVRCDDSVTRIVANAELPVRRSRGHAPQPVTLPLTVPRPLLAVGGQLKATFALGRERHAFLSHHLGDLDHYAAFHAFERDIALYQDLFGLKPELIAHDLHPDYASTGYARKRGLPLLAVQHHHAHLASCMAEHGLNEPVIGVTFDGTGYGTDGAIWGGEVLVGEYRHFHRGAQLRYVRMPGGEQAIKEPWRMALAHLRDAGLSTTLLQKRVPPSALRTATTMLERGFNAPPTSSAGRLFDAVAVLAGLRERVNYEGQAAVELEWLATGLASAGTYPFALETGEGALVVDTRPLITAVARDAERGIEARVLARRFHTTMVDMIAVVCQQVRSATGLAKVVLSGGVFLNALLTGEVSARLGDVGFKVYRHRLVPPNDGGLSLGQLAVAAAVSG